VVVSDNIPKGGCVKPASLDQRTQEKFSQDFYLETWVEAFLVDRKARNLARGTQEFYRDKLKLFLRFCSTQAITGIDQITPGTIREYLLWLEENHHNPGGIHAHYRAAKTFLTWWADEVEPEGWKNPFRKVPAPKLGKDPLDPASMKSIQEMLKHCDSRSLLGTRDRAILLSLLDTGARASEFVAMNLADYDQVSGSVLIRQGKGRKPRMVFLGQRSRKAIRTYLRHRADKCPVLWVNNENEPLTYWGLREIVRRRAKDANVKPPTLHSFRRAFALAMLRKGVDIFVLQKLMGHADIQVLRRYLAQTDEDGKEAHDQGGPVDNSEL
jgi:integrase/recombinase XerC